MAKKYLVTWLTIAGVIGILFGIFYALFGLEGLPVYRIFVPQAGFEGWSRGLYGSTFIGFSVLLLFGGRRAILQNDKPLAAIILGGLMAWLVVEAFVSLIYGVYINVAVDVFLALCLGLPLVTVLRK